MKAFAALLLVCTSIALGRAAGQLPTAVSARGVPQNIIMSKSRGDEAETAVAVSHANPLQITTVSNRQSGAGTFHSWSTDGGLT